MDRDLYNIYQPKDDDDTRHQVNIHIENTKRSNTQPTLIHDRAKRQTYSRYQPLAPSRYPNYFYPGQYVYGNNAISNEDKPHIKVSIETEKRHNIPKNVKTDNVVSSIRSLSNIAVKQKRLSPEYYEQINIPSLAEKNLGIIHNIHLNEDIVATEKRDEIQRVNKRQVGAVYNEEQPIVRATVHGKKAEKNPILQLLRAAAGQKTQKILGLNSKSFDIFPGPLPEEHASASNNLAKVSNEAPNQMMPASIDQQIYNNFHNERHPIRHNFMKMRAPHSGMNRQMPTLGIHRHMSPMFPQPMIPEGEYSTEQRQMTISDPEYMPQQPQQQHQMPDVRNIMAMPMQEQIPSESMMMQRGPPQEMMERQESQGMMQRQQEQQMMQPQEIVPPQGMFQKENQMIQEQRLMAEQRHDMNQMESAPPGMQSMSQPPGIEPMSQMQLMGRVPQQYTRTFAPQEERMTSQENALIEQNKESQMRFNGEPQHDYPVNGGARPNYEGEIAAIQEMKHAQDEEQLRQLAETRDMDQQQEADKLRQEQVGEEMRQEEEQQEMKSELAARQELPTIRQNVPSATSEMMPTARQQVPSIGQEFHAINQELPTYRQELPTLRQEFPTIRQELSSLERELPAVPYLSNHMMQFPERSEHTLPLMAVMNKNYGNGERRFDMAHNHIHPNVPHSHTPYTPKMISRLHSRPKGYNYDDQDGGGDDDEDDDKPEVHVHISTEKSKIAKPKKDVNERKTKI